FFSHGSLRGSEEVSILSVQAPTLATRGSSHVVYLEAVPQSESATPAHKAAGAAFSARNRATGKARTAEHRRRAVRRRGIPRPAWQGSRPWRPGRMERAGGSGASPRRGRSGNPGEFGISRPDGSRIL